MSLGKRFIAIALDDNGQPYARAGLYARASDAWQDLEWEHKTVRVGELTLDDNRDVPHDEVDGQIKDHAIASHNERLHVTFAERDAGTRHLLRPSDDSAFRRTPLELPAVTVTFKDSDVEYDVWPVHVSTTPGGNPYIKDVIGCHALHRPTGLAAVSIDEHSQPANRRVALERLRRAVTQHATASEPVTDRTLTPPEWSALFEFQHTLESGHTLLDVQRAALFTAISKLRAHASSVPALRPTDEDLARLREVAIESRRELRDGNLNARRGDGAHRVRNAVMELLDSGKLGGAL